MARTLVVLMIVVGQLWALTAALEGYLSGHVSRAWWLAAFSILSFAAVAVLVGSSAGRTPRARHRR